MQEDFGTLIIIYDGNTITTTTRPNIQKTIHIYTELRKMNEEIFTYILYSLNVHKETHIIYIYIYLLLITVKTNYLQLIY